MTGDIACVIGVNRFPKPDRYPVGMNVESDGQLDILTGVAKPLKTTRIGSIRSPSVHTRQVK